MKVRPRSLARHPLVIIPPLVVLLIFGWRQYTYAGRDLSLPSARNIFPNSDFTEFDSGGIPAGWTIAKSGDSAYQVGRGTGYTGKNSFSLAVRDYRNGDISLASPKVRVEPGTVYLFKGYYTADMPFDLLMRSYLADGSATLDLLRSYPGTAGTWSTASHAFRAPPTMVAAQFIYRQYADGQFQLDSPYLEPQTDVYLPATSGGGDNTIPNAGLTSSTYDTPADWSTYRTGGNTTTFSYHLDPAGNYVQAQVDGYKDGQAKWQYPAQPTQPDEHYQARVEYRSDVAVPLVAEYTLMGGQRQDQVIATLSPASEWTSVDFPFETVPHAATLFLALPLEQNGTVASRHYSLSNITRAGDTQWSHPVVSITFDNGWQQAYEAAMPVLNQYAYHATFYVNPSAIETTGYMTAAELTTLKLTGNEIGSHGYEHQDMTAINSSALDYQLRRGRDYLRAAGFQVSDFATPYGRSDSQVQWYARQYFTTLRGNETGFNTRQTIDPYALKVLPIDDHTTPQMVASALQQAKDYHGWLIISYQQLGATPLHTTPSTENAAVSLADFKQQMNLIHASGIPVLPVDAAYQTLEKP